MVDEIAATRPPVRAQQEPAQASRARCGRMSSASDLAGGVGAAVDQGREGWQQVVPRRAWRQITDQPVVVLDRV